MGRVIHRVASYCLFQYLATVEGVLQQDCTRSMAFRFTVRGFRENRLSQDNCHLRPTDAFQD